jgi:hypothetical protein
VNTSIGRLAFDTIIVLAICAVAIILAFRKDDPPKRLDCSALCAPRSVLAGPATACECAPDDSWIVKAIDSCDKTCGPVPFDVKASRDGSFECACVRPGSVGVYKVKKGNGP